MADLFEGYHESGTLEWFVAMILRCVAVNGGLVAQMVTFHTARDVQPDEELTFFYGANLWFQNAEAPGSGEDVGMNHDHMDDEDAFLANMAL